MFTKKLFTYIASTFMLVLIAVFSLFGLRVGATENPQESFSLVTLDNFSPSANRTYNFMGAKLEYSVSSARFFIKPADDPASVTTLVLPAMMCGKTVAYAYFDLSGYTNLDTLIMFDSGQFCREVLKTMHLTNLYLGCHLYINDYITGIQADNVYYVGTFDSSQNLSGQTVAYKLLALNANHYYYYDWSSPYFDEYAQDFDDNYNLTFEKKLASECRFTEESFCLTPNYSVTYTEAGITYVRQSAYSSYPPYTETCEFASKMIAVDSRIKTLKVPGNVDMTLISGMDFDVAIIKGVNQGYINGIDADIYVVASNSSYFDGSITASAVYFTTDTTNYQKITNIRGNCANIDKFYIPRDEAEKFSKISDTYPSKVELYDDLPSFAFKFTDNNGEHTYKTRGFNANIDYCLRNLDILAFYGEQVTENDFLEDKFDLYDLAIAPELQTYTVSFDTGDLVEVASQKLRVLENLPSPTVAHYTFNGWFTDDEFTSAVVEGTEIQSATTLYGKFTHDKYTLRFNTIGVVENPEAVLTDYITELPRLFTESQKVEGWYYDNAFSHKANVGDELTDTTVLYAKWVDLSYEVSFDTDGLATVESISVLRLPNLPTPSANGYEFLGWFYDEEFTRQARANDTLINDTTLYAKWNEIKYTLTFDCRGKASVEAIECGVLRDLPEPENESYTFAGWFYDLGYTSEAHNGDVINNNTTLYAKWDEITYLVVFDTNDMIEVPSMRMLTLRNLPQPKINGYKLDGWYYDQALTELAQAGDVLSDDVILYAKWSLENGGYYIVEPKAIYSSNMMDAKALVAKLQGSLVYLDGVDVTNQALFTYAYISSIDNTKDYNFTLIATIESNTLTKLLNVKIDNSLGNVIVVIGQDNNIYCGFNVQDYDNFDEVTRILNNFIKAKMNISNPNVRLPQVQNMLTRVYEGTYNGGAIYALASGVNLKYSSPTRVVDESIGKMGYTSCDRFIITSDIKVEEAIRQIAPYILKKDGILVEDYKMEIIVASNMVSLKYIVNGETVKEHGITYAVVDSSFSYIAGFNTDYTDAVLLINKTEEDLNFNEIYKDALKKGYAYVNNLDPDYELDLSEEGKEVFTDNIMRGNGSYYESVTTVYVVDEAKANAKGQAMLQMTDNEGNEIKYEAPADKQPITEKVTETVNGWMNTLKEKIESNKGYKVASIAIGSVFGILIVYGVFLLLRKAIKWLRRR